MGGRGPRNLYIQSMQGHSDRDTLVERAAAYCDRERLLRNGDTVVVAVSGGLDSVVLLHVLVAMRTDWDLSLHVAHLNHGLRHDNADEDQAFTRTLAASYGLPFHTDRVDCAALARARKRTVEETARQERSAFLLRVAKETDAERVATAHHRDDQTETVLMRLLRGSGTTGLAGIRPLRDDLWIRPFLDLNREALRAYAAESGLTWREDESNRDLAIPRNRIRNVLIPLLKQDYESGASEAVARAAEVLRADDDLLDAITLDASKTVICAHSERKFALDGPRFFGYHVAVQRRLIRHVLLLAGVDPRRVSFRLIERLLTRFAEGPAEVQVTSDLTACCTGRLILLGTRAPAFEEQIKPGPNRIDEIDARLTVEDVVRAEFPTRFTAMTPFETWFDRRNLPDDLVLRTVRPGDRIRPFGSHGTAKVSDVLIDRKVPHLVRDEIPVLAAPSEVLWIVGVRASETTRIHETSSNAVRLTFDGSWRDLYSAMKQHT